MKAFLTLGKSHNGELVGIASQNSGKTELICPFCSVSLIAVKGAINEHHFRHDGETCKESLNKLPEIPGWDHFHLSVPDHLVAELQAHAEKGTPAYWGQKVGELYEHDLLVRDDFSSNWVLTEAGLVISGQLSLAKFSEWFRQRLKERVAAAKQAVAAGRLHHAHFEIEAWRQQQILTATLYLVQLELADGSVFYKVGRTRREVTQRLAEVAADMKLHHNQPIKASVLKAIPSAGYVEKYALWKQRKNRYEAGSHQEYLQLNAAEIRNLKSDLTRFENSKPPFDREERFISSGRWRYEHKRLAAVRSGVAKTIEQGSKFGRPPGTTKVGTADWLSQHKDIIDCISRGFSISKTSAITGKSISTVKRVKKQIGSISAAI